MTKLALQKVVTLVTALALGSACIANVALARDGGGGLGGGSGGDHIAGGFSGGYRGFPGGRMGGDFHAGHSNAYGFNCWKSQVVPTNAAWRLRQAEAGTCY
jgi:uncharacterized membrane protein